MKGKKGFLLLGLSFGALAAAAPSNEWTLGLSALYLQPSYSTTPIYGTITNKKYETLQIVTTSDNLSVNSQYDFGYEAFLQYHFHQAKRDITLSYMHFSNTMTDSIDLGSLNSALVYTQFYYTAEGKVFSSVDSADLVAGQWWHPGKDLAMRFYGGIAYARVEQDFTELYDEGLDLQPNANSQNIYNKSQFNGAGPKFGADADYVFKDSEFGMMAGISAALLLGPIDHQVTTTHPGGVGNNATIRSNYDSALLSVPNLNANLALRYEKNYDENLVHVEAGYRINQFLNAIYADNTLTLSGFYLNLAVSFL